jgi:hypothetical protein
MKTADLVAEAKKPRQNPNLQNVRNRQSKILTHAFVKRQLWVEISARLLRNFAKSAKMFLFLEKRRQLSKKIKIIELS